MEKYKTEIVWRGETLEQVEREVLLQALEVHGGNKTAAARALGISARTILNKLRKYPELSFAGDET